MNIAMEDYDFTSLVADENAATPADIDGTTNKSMAYILTKRLNSATNITDSYTFPASIDYYSEHTCTASDISATDQEGELCYGATNPNAVTVCTKGQEGGTGDDESTGACQVESTGINDIFPVYFYGQTVEPASDAARAVLFGK